MNTHTVRGACPHDCPDTCARRVTVRHSRAPVFHDCLVDVRPA